MKIKDLKVKKHNGSWKTCFASFWIKEDLLKHGLKFRWERNIARLVFNIKELVLLLEMGPITGSNIGRVRPVSGIAGAFCLCRMISTSK